MFSRTPAGIVALTLSPLKAGGVGIGVAEARATGEDVAWVGVGTTFVDAGFIFTATDFTRTTVVCVAWTGNLFAKAVSTTPQQSNRRDSNTTNALRIKNPRHFSTFIHLSKSL